MTERTIRAVAKELAGTFYEEAGGDLFGSAPEDRARSKRFRETYPTVKHFMTGMQVQSDGSLKPDQPGWHYFITLARARLVQMLADPMQKPGVKEGIYKALQEEHVKSTSPMAQEILQRRLGDGQSSFQGR